MGNSNYKIKPINMEKTLQERLSTLQKKLEVPKSQYNAHGNYNYRNAEDILDAVKKQLLDGETIRCSDEIVQIGDRYYVKAEVCLSNGKESICNIAYAREAEERKGMDSSQITGATSSYARKYALNGLFAIDDVKDADSMDNRQAPTKTQGSVSVPQGQGTSYPASVKQIALLKKNGIDATGMTSKEASAKISEIINGKVKSSQGDTPPDPTEDW